MDEGSDFGCPRKWVECKHRNLHYHLTQRLTGRGSFSSYLFKHERVKNNLCVYCGPVEIPNPKKFEWERWKGSRALIEDALGEKMMKENVIGRMTKRESKFRGGIVGNERKGTE